MYRSLKKYLFPLIFAAAIASLNFMVWVVANRATPLPEAPPAINGFAYSAFHSYRKDPPTKAELTSDLNTLSPLSHRIRTYGSLEDPELFNLSSHLGFSIAVGAWLDNDSLANKREMESLNALLQKKIPFERAIIGNEVLLRKDMPLEELTQYLDQIRDQKKVPVSTGEPWHIWLKYPELVPHTDFITLHLLPYHEGVPIDRAVDYIFERYNEVKKAYPQKKIVIGEVGWPSDGPTVGAAVPSITNQARFVREFLAKTAGKDYDYYLMEAFDQPWKVDIEGWAGPYWGMFDANRQPKYSLEGAVPNDKKWFKKDVWATAIGFLLILFIPLLFRHWGMGAYIALALLLQGCITILVITLNLPGEYYYTLQDIIAFIFLMAVLLISSGIVMTQGVEFSEVIFKGEWLRAYHGEAPLPKEKEPFVSLHLPCCNEPPEMVIATIDSFTKLHYSNFEVIVIDNNTKQEALWKPVEAYISTLPSNFHFFHLPKWPGFKAGALNFALTKSAPHAEIIGVVDADYIVNPDWLSVTIPHFAAPETAVLQAPQAHREWEHRLFSRMCNWEFEGFFHIGMHHRHERNALIQHGTMTLVRKCYLQEAKGWSEWCICEDTELGLKLLEKGYELRYIDETFGRGLTPKNFQELKNQRFRWAFGAMQILKHHLSELLGPSTLNLYQRYHFLTGWSGWFGNALHFIFTLFGIAFTVGMVAFPKTIYLPSAIILTPVFFLLIVKVMLESILYRRIMHCSWSDILGASLINLGLTHVIAKGIIMGLIKKESVFKPTAKGKESGKKLSLIHPIREELALLLALAGAVAALLITRGLNGIEIELWLMILLVQALPYISAIACQFISQSDWRT